MLISPRVDARVTRLGLAAFSPEASQSPLNSLSVSYRFFSLSRFSLPFRSNSRPRSNFSAFSTPKLRLSRSEKYLSLPFFVSLFLPTPRPPSYLCRPLPLHCLLGFFTSHVHEGGSIPRPRLVALPGGEGGGCFRRNRGDFSQNYEPPVPRKPARRDLGEGDTFLTTCHSISKTRESGATSSSVPRKRGIIETAMTRNFNFDVLSQTYPWPFISPSPGPFPLLSLSLSLFQLTRRDDKFRYL